MHRLNRQRVTYYKGFDNYIHRLQQQWNDRQLLFLANSQKSEKSLLLTKLAGIYHFIIGTGKWQL